MLSSVTHSVSSWLGATKPDDEGATEEKEPQKDTSQQEQNTESKEPTDVEEESQDLQHQIDELGTKAVTTAKEWGSKCVYAKNLSSNTFMLTAQFSSGQEDQTGTKSAKLRFLSKSRTLTNMIYVSCRRKSRVSFDGIDPILGFFAL